LFWFRIWSFVSVRRKGRIESRGRKGIILSIVGIVMAEASTAGAALGRSSLSALPHSDAEIPILKKKKKKKKKKGTI
jgi:hypothetical protein